MVTTDGAESTEDPVSVLLNAASRNVSHTAVVRVCSGEACHWKRKPYLSSSQGPIPTVDRVD